MLTCKFENGAKTSLRHVVVDALCVNNKNEILLVKRATHLICGGKYAFPGGYLDRDETAQEAIVREVLEETGYQSQVIKLFLINDDPKRPQEDRQNVAFIYIMQPISKSSQRDKESTEIKWFPLDKLPKPEDVAFDHYEVIKKYKEYLKKPFSLPLIR